MGVNKVVRACLDLHDFSVVNNRLDLLWKLYEHFDYFKVSLFTVPVDEERSWGPYCIRENIAREVRDLRWVQLIPHGLHHKRFEFSKCNCKTFRKTLSLIEKAFEKDGLPYEKGFCPPHWRWTEHVVKVLDEAGWWGAIDRDKKMEIPKRFYQYNYLLNEPFWEAGGDLKLHGHVYGTKNDVGRCFENLLKLPEDTKWCFVTDFLEDKDETI